MSSLQKLVDNAIDELKEWINNNPGDDPTDYAIFEITDSSVPVYNGDLLELASDNWELMTNEPDIGPAFDGSPTPINIIAANIFEYIESKLWDAWRDIEDETAYCCVCANEITDKNDAGDGYCSACYAMLPDAYDGDSDEDNDSESIQSWSYQYDLDHGRVYSCQTYAEWCAENPMVDQPSLPPNC